MDRVQWWLIALAFARVRADIRVHYSARQT